MFIVSSGFDLSTEVSKLETAFVAAVLSCGGVTSALVKIWDYALNLS